MSLSSLTTLGRSTGLPLRKVYCRPLSPRAPALALDTYLVGKCGVKSKCEHYIVEKDCQPLQNCKTDVHTIPHMPLSPRDLDPWQLRNLKGQRLQCVHHLKG